MKSDRLKFIQNLGVGAAGIPFESIDLKVIVFLIVLTDRN
jgi:hypothetical protein